MIFVFLSLIIDYVLTYIGIAKGIIVEGNPLMAPFFEYAFGIGICIRVAMSAILMLPFIYVRNKSINHYRFLVKFSLLIYSFVFAIHFHWIIVSVLMA